MGARKIILNYTNNSSSKKHQFVAKVMEDQKILKTRTFSIGRDRNVEEAYEELIAAAQVLGKEYKVKLGEFPPIDNLVASARGQSSGTRKSRGSVQVKQNALVEKFNNHGQFKALISLGIKTHGAEKMSEVLNAGLEIVRDAQDEERRKSKIVYEANRQIAEVVIDARSKGVPMPASAEVESIIDELTRQRARRKSNGRYAGSTYSLNGEIWDGEGQPPASYSRWLAEDDTRDLVSLKIT